jgi:hypothetical protein
MNTTVEVDGTLFSGRIYHVRENGWPCVENATCAQGCQWCGPGHQGHIASGPEVMTALERIKAAEALTCEYCGKTIGETHAPMVKSQATGWRYIHLSHLPKMGSERRQGGRAR